MSNICEDKYGGHKWTDWYLTGSAAEQWEQRECRRCNIEPQTRTRRLKLIRAITKRKRK